MFIYPNSILKHVHSAELVVDGTHVHFVDIHGEQINDPIGL